MPPFRLVDGAQAGAGALGILVPPGRRTVVVARPRGLDVDLLLVRRATDAPGAGFHEGGPGEAAVLAQNLSQALMRCADNGKGRVEVVAAAEGPGHWVRVQMGTLALLVCPRLAGQAYRPLTFPTPEEAKPIAEAVANILCPQAEANQELYINTMHFAR